MHITLPGLGTGARSRTEATGTPASCASLASSFGLSASQALMMPTIVVVATTLVIFAIKVFDVPYVMTNGNFNTDVLALRMYNLLYLSHNNGAASAVAIVLLIAVVPVLVFNLRQFKAVEARR